MKLVLDHIDVVETPADRCSVILEQTYRRSIRSRLLYASTAGHRDDPFKKADSTFREWIDAFGENHLLCPPWSIQTLIESWDTQFFLFERAIDLMPPHVRFVLALNANPNKTCHWLTR